MSERLELLFVEITQTVGGTWVARYLDLSTALSETHEYVLVRMPSFGELMRRYCPHRPEPGLRWVVDCTTYGARQNERVMRLAK